MSIHPKPKLRFWQIWNMSFGFMGIQFGFALQNANTSRIFETLGAEVDDLAVYWLAAPLTGLLVQPIIGYFSDRTWNRLGRRKPYFLIGAILSSIALICMPNSPTLWMAIGMLWILDASINITMEPFRAFVGDNLSDTQRTIGFTMQSFFIGIGGFVGSAMPYLFSHWFQVDALAPEGVIPATVKYSFYLGALFLISTVLWTVFRSKEYSPQQLADYADIKHTHSAHFDQPAFSRQRRSGWWMTIAGVILTLIWLTLDVKRDLYILSVGIAIVGLLFVIAAELGEGGRRGAFVEIMFDLHHMPDTMKQLAWVQFFSWFAMFAMWIYATSAVTAHIYGTTDTTSSLYNEGADFVGWLMGIKFLVAAMASFMIPFLAKSTNKQIAHMTCLCLGGIGLISYYFVRDPSYLLISMVGVGIAWASILSMPYAMLSSSLPADKMGYYMGVFNFFIVIPQIVAASILGFIVGQIFSSQAIYAFIIGGVSMICAGLLTLRVK